MSRWTHDRRGARLARSCFRHLRRRLRATGLWVLVGAALVVAACGRTGAPTPGQATATSDLRPTATPTTPSTPVPPTPTVSAALRLDALRYANGHGVDLNEAIRRLLVIKEIRLLSATLTSKEGDTFGGFWIEHQPAFRVVATFTRDGAQTIQPYIQGKPWADLVEVREVRATLEELYAAEILTRQALYRLDFKVSTAIDTVDNRVEVWVTDPLWVEAELRRSGIELPELAELVVKGGESARGIEICEPSPVPGVVFLRQTPVEGVRATHALATAATLELSDGCLRFGGSPGRKGPVLVWPPGFTLRERDGEIQLIRGRNEVVARVGEEICIATTHDPGMPECVARQLPPACRGNYWFVGDLVRPNLRRDSRLFTLDLITTTEQSLVFLRKRPMLDEWAHESTPLSGALRLKWRRLMVKPKGAQHPYTLFWPPDYSAREKDGQFEIVDGAGQVVTRVGQQVSLPGGEIPKDWDSSRYQWLARDLPCNWDGPYWVVAD